MKQKRILPSVSLLFVLTTSVLISPFLSIHAQTYKKGVELNDSLVQFTQKKTFKHAGDKLMTYEALQDTSKKTQLITIKLLNPDFTTFKTFSRELPIDYYVMYFHNGVDVIELMDKDKPVYYWRYTTDDEDEQGNYHNFTTVLNEASDSLFTLEVSFHGATTFENGLNTKIVGESVVHDTIHYQQGDWYGWYTMQVMTSSIYDLKTGLKECTFPKGTQFSHVAVVNDTARIYTRNHNMVNFLTEYHPLGSLSTCMKTLVFNMDYTLSKELDYPFASIGLNLDNLYQANTYEPLYDGHNLFFRHSFYSYIKDGEGGVIGYSNRHVLTDKNGVLVKLLDNPTDTPASALWLPSQNKTVLMSYSGVVYSSSTMDSIAKVTDYANREDGSVAFAQVNKDSVLLLNEQFNVTGSFPALSEEWMLSDFSQKKVVSDGLLELVFRNYNNGVKVLNENGQLLVNEPESAWKMDFMDYTPIFLMEKGHKYANLVDDSLGLWYRVAPLKAQAMNQQAIIPTSLQVYSQLNDSILLVDSVSGTGLYDGMLPEGTYFVRTVSNNLPSTYYPSALMWEDATPVNFTTDSLPVLTITQPAAPQPLSPANEAVLAGSLSSDVPTLLQSIDVDHVRVYIKQLGSSEIMAIGTLNKLVFEVEHLPYGTYEVLIDIPGKRMLTNITIILSTGQKQGEVQFSLMNNGVSGSVITGLAKHSAEKAFEIVPNPASDRIRLNASFEGCAIELFDMAGRSVLSTRVQGGEVQISQLPEGPYMIRLQTKNGLLLSMLLKK